MNEVCNIQVRYKCGKIKGSMVSKSGAVSTDCNTSLNGMKMHLANEFVYLGSMSENENSIDGEINEQVNAILNIIGASGSFHWNEDSTLLFMKV